MEIYREKLKVMNKLNQRIGKENRVLEFCEDNEEILSDLNKYISDLINELWDEPKLVVSIIEHAHKEVLTEQLAPFFVNNFYENILSSNYIEDKLMYVLTLLLKSEINKLSNINQSDKFLDETPCGILLGEFRRRSDIQEYFNNIIKNAIEKLEENNSTFIIDFNPEEIDKYYNIKFSGSLKDEPNLKYPSTGYSGIESIDVTTFKDKKKEQIEQENFNKNYIPNLDKNALIKLIEENKNDKNMHEYLDSKLTLCEKDNDIFINQKLLTFFSKLKNPESLINLYQKRFMIVISFIDNIIKNILENIHLIPHSIKCLCRIISEIIQQKFPNINIPDKNAFIAKFFFGKLLIPMLNNPNFESLINIFISKNTSENLKIISKILDKFVSGMFYTTNNFEFNFTPFNWYFIKNSNKLFGIFKDLKKVRFPLFIDNLINNKLLSDYEYNYFKENPDEVINFRSIFFNLEQILAIVQTMNEFEREIFKDNKSKIRKAVEKLMTSDNQQLFEEIIRSEKEIKGCLKKDKRKEGDKKKKKNDENENKEIKSILHYFLITGLDSNEKYKNLFKIEEKKYFSLTELKELKDEKSITKNNIIKVKNLFFILLYNYHKLVKTDFGEGTTENTEKILKELYMFMKSPNFVMNGSIPFDWYIKSLLEYLKRLPEYLTKNDCEELYNEMENVLKESIKELDFEVLSDIKSKLKYANRSKAYYKQSLELLEDIESNEEARKIISNQFIPVDIKFEYDIGDENIFKIEKSKFEEKDMNDEEKKRNYEKSNKIKLSVTIESFSVKFPNLVKYQENQGADIFEIQENLNFPKQITNYFDIIKEDLERNNVRIIKSIMEKIYDYIMGKIYDKIYPIEPLEKDNQIFKKTVLLSWIQPKHFFRRKKEYVFGNFENKIMEYFKLLDMDKSPRKKFIDLNNIFKSIGLLLAFNGNEFEQSVDDIMPILNYAIIKAKPLRIYSITKFMELYKGDKYNRVEENRLIEFKGICECTLNLNHTYLKDVTLEEFNQKCNEVIKKFKY